MQHRALIKIAAPLVIVFLVFVIPIFHFNFDVATVLTIDSLVFTILLGFFIATATTNYVNLKNLISQEEAGLMMMYTHSKLIQPEAAERVGDAVDTYVISWFDYELDSYVENTEKEFAEVVRAVDAVDPVEVSPRSQVLLDHLQYFKLNLIQLRQTIALVAQRLVLNEHWLVLLALSGSIALMLLSFRDGSAFLNVIIGLLVVSMYLVLVVLYEVDCNLFAEEFFAYRNTQRIFRVLKRPGYYSEMAIKNGRVTTLPPVYRIGRYKNPGKSLEKEISIVRQSE